MRLGLFMMPLHPPERPMAETLAEDTEKSLLADRLGFQELWIGEHFSASSEPIASPLMFMAGLAPRTKLIFGTGVINLPNHHPAMVAAEAAQFDQMTGGRLILGIGPGGLASDWELFGNTDPALRGKRMVEAIDTILAIWAQDPPYDIPGATWTTKITEAVIPAFGVGTMPKPFQHPHPPIAVTARSIDSFGVKLAVQRGWQVLSANFVAERVVEGHWRTMQAALAGKPAAHPHAPWRVARNFCIAASDAEARERMFHPDGANRYYFHYLSSLARRAGQLATLKPSAETPDEAVTLEAIIEDCVICGAPGTVLDKLVALRERVGPFDHLLMAGLDWSGPNAAWEQETMRRLAEEVMPRFRQHVAASGAKAAE
ncbi:LLM class flavin-dependent oxidoreductase [Siccirubricoccus phaeus]|uniref:LLM class flavin-dependent oxidoreductase n=1 Tax=Siccirubricoccus phaeus TaxID=2595053 RepID=UPI0011F32C7C|nr:LLM class flavin-dependent oxidoreductase [Siccirubricoccus phaeus]